MTHFCFGRCRPEIGMTSKDADNVIEIEAPTLVEAVEEFYELFPYDDIDWVTRNGIMLNIPPFALQRPVMCRLTA